MDLASARGDPTLAADIDLLGEMDMRLLCVLLLLLGPTAAGAQEAELPEIVTEGFSQLVSSGPDAGLSIWLESWTSERDKLQRAQLESGFRGIWDRVGPASAYDVFAVCRLGSHVQYAYAILVHEAQPVYVALGLYLAAKGWRVANVAAHTEITEVIPEPIRTGASSC